LAVPFFSYPTESTVLTPVRRLVLLSVLIGTSVWFELDEAGLPTVNLLMLFI